MKGGEFMDRRSWWSPLQDAIAIRAEMNRLFDAFHNPSYTQGSASIHGTWIPPVNIYEVPDSFVVQAELPGIPRENLNIEIRERLLTVQGERTPEVETGKTEYYLAERSHGSFECSFILPSTIDHERVQATYRDGVLELRLPKVEEAERRVIIGGSCVTSVP
jgi:HSP20 family protein